MEADLNLTAPSLQTLHFSPSLLFHRGFLPVSPLQEPSV